MNPDSPSAQTLESARATASAGQQQQRGLTAVVAMTPAGVIGREGGLPWRLKTDLQRFKKLTMGGVLIMGRRTYESIGRPLPGRTTIVITRRDDWTSDGVELAKSPEQAIQIARKLAGVGERGIFVVGGAEIYQQLLPACTELWLTRVLCESPGDTTLALDLSQFDIVERTSFPASEQDEAATEFLRMVRKKT